MVSRMTRRKPCAGTAPCNRPASPLVTRRSSGIADIAVDGMFGLRGVTDMII